MVNHISRAIKLAKEAGSSELEDAEADEEDEDDFESFLFFVTLIGFDFGGLPEATRLRSRLCFF